LLTNLPVNSPEEAKGVVEIYRKRWTVEEFFRLLKAGLGFIAHPKDNSHPVGVSDISIQGQNGGESL